MSLHQLSPDARSSVLFVDRHEAGECLAQKVLEVVQTLETPHRFVVYALPRGGIPVAVPVAKALNCPLDVLVAKKITRPQNPELAIGAVTADGHILRQSKQRIPDWDEALERAQTKAKEQLAQFTERPDVDPEGAIALIVDDGIATGMTIEVAALSLQERHPEEIWICAPVAPAELMEQLEQNCDRVIILATPDPFYSVSRFYGLFPQVELEDAILDLKKSLQT